MDLPDRFSEPPLLFKIGIYAGAVALAPLALSVLVAISKPLIVNIIFGIAIAILTGGHGIRPGTYVEVSCVPLPLIVWKVSLVLAAVGGIVLVVTLLSLLIFGCIKDHQRNAAFLRRMEKNKI